MVLPRAALPGVEVVLERSSSPRPTSTTRASASSASGARPRFVWTSTPVAFSTRRSRGLRMRGELLEHAVDERPRVTPGANLLACPIEDDPRGDHREGVRLSRQPLVSDEAIDGGQVAERGLAGHAGQCRRVAVTPQARAGASAGAQ